jgi:hypothetical protein
MTIYYVYEHVRNDTGEVFYVGKGKGSRCHAVTGRNQHWHRVVAKHGFVALKVAETLEEELAFLVEVERIDQLRRLGVSLCNKTDGGEGASGAVRSPETLAKMSAWQVGRRLPQSTRDKLSKARSEYTGWNPSPETLAKMSQVHRGERNAMFGRKASEETRRKLSERGTGRKYAPEFGAAISARQTGELNPMFGRPVPPEVREKLSAALKGRPRPQRRVTCPHCGTSGGMNAMTRHHFDNCRKREEK